MWPALKGINKFESSSEAEETKAVLIKRYRLILSKRKDFVFRELEQTTTADPVQHLLN